MGLTIHPEFAAIKNSCGQLQERLLELVIEKDELVTTIIPNIEAEYQLRIGALMFQKFCLQTEINKSKRAMEIIQTALNHGDPISASSVQDRLEIEFREWEERLKEHLEKIENARELEKSRLSAEESRQIVELYRRLVKKLHPDVNSDLYSQYRILWGQVQEAYGNGDYESLAALWMIVRDLEEQESEITLSSTLETLRQKENQLKKSIRKVRSIITDIISAHPYILKDKLMDRDWVDSQREILEEEISGLSVQNSRFRIMADQMVKEHCHG